MNDRVSPAWLIAALVAVTLPLLWPAVPPLNDLPGHIGRYHIAAELMRSPDLQRHWDYRWALIGNLGVDVPAIALTPWLGAERAAKLVVLAIPAIFVGALWMLGHVRGQSRPPLAGFAFALAYGQAFQLGFVNFALATALALAALAGWIRLVDRALLRTAVFVPVAWVLWIAHSSGWGIFGLGAWAAELMLARERGARPAGAVVRATLACIPLALPMLAMIGGGGGPAADTLWDLTAKAAWIASLVRDRWRWFDVLSATIIIALAWTAIRRRDWRIDPVLGAVAAILLAAFLVLPRLALNGAYVDMRLLAPGMAILLIGVRIEPRRMAVRLFVAGAIFLAVRMIATTVSFAMFAAVQQETAEAIDHLPRGAAVLTLVNEPCWSQWHSDRLGHVGGLAIARRDVFENGQWAIRGQQLLTIEPPVDVLYHADPSQLVYPAHCEYRTTELKPALEGFDRHRFTHVWLIGFPNATIPRDLRLVFANRRSVLYSVSSR